VRALPEGVVPLQQEGPCALERAGAQLDRPLRRAGHEVHRSTAEDQRRPEDTVPRGCRERRDDARVRRYHRVPERALRL
ncbi:MAG: hypothetical protein AVDCRST_MAG37-450, partial [uncultured Rubrobacteraceae bacterium]